MSLDRTNCQYGFVLLSLYILQAGSVNLYKLRGHVGRILGVDIQASSGYKHLIRIFDLHAYSRLWMDLCHLGISSEREKFSKVT